MPDTTPQRKSAEELKRAYTTATQALRANKDLSDEGRRRQLAENYKAARQRLSDLRAKERAQLAKREVELERRLFGGQGHMGGADAISARDAQDRASRLTRPQEAANLLDRAEQNGDKALAHAVAHHALQQARAALTPDAVTAWDAVLTSFIEARPHVTPIIEEFAMIERLSVDTPFGPYSLTRPAEVSAADINSPTRPDHHAQATTT